MKLELKGRDTELILTVMHAYIHGLDDCLSYAGKKRLADIEAKQVCKYLGYLNKDLFKERAKNNLEALNDKEKAQAFTNS
tara:strand:- start:3536 stop:3775 length:240 start_codon:yes stop_codon:yes gene_type:complete